jgi:hypothetical protein
MSSREDLIATLASLDSASFEDVISSAYQQRLGPAGAAPPTRPDSQAMARQFAEWLARRHMSSDLAIERVIYLPTGAQDDEIRLLEVNRLLHPPDPDVIESLDFSPDDLPFKVFVADVTSDQWERIKREPDAVLPPGWRLDGNVTFTRG